jgi:hypothetical protein
VNPNGTWTLFVADVSGGSISTINGWSLEIIPVPEPINVALGIFAAVGLSLSAFKAGRRHSPAL